MELVLKDRKFDGTDGVLIFDFLRSLIREASFAGMRKAQLYLMLLRMLRKSVHEHFIAIRDCFTPEERGLSSWPEAA